MVVLLGFELPRERRLLTRYFEQPSQPGRTFVRASFLPRHNCRLVALKNCALLSNHYRLDSNAVERSSYLLRSVSLKSHIVSLELEHNVFMFYFH
jgi:hypothetical protein